VAVPRPMVRSLSHIDCTVERRRALREPDPAQRPTDIGIVQSGIVLQAHLYLFEQEIVSEQRNEGVITERCDSAAGRDPTHKPAQVGHSACLFALMAGSRSAPIGTPPSDDSKPPFRQID
jgi:hypothetical protein